MSTVLTPFKSLARWLRKLRGAGAPLTAGPDDSRAQNARDAGAGEPLAGKWPEQPDMMTRLTTSGRVIKLNGAVRDNNKQIQEMRVHHDTRPYNVYKFPEM